MLPESLGPGFHLTTLGYRCMLLYPTPDFYMGSGDLNPGPLSCEVKCFAE